jgi:hypothetical protein
VHPRAHSDPERSRTVVTLEQLESSSKITFERRKQQIQLNESKQTALMNNLCGKGRVRVSPGNIVPMQIANFGYL